MENDFIERLKHKVDKIKSKDFIPKYDYFKLKNIIQENLRTIKGKSTDEYLNSPDTKEDIQEENEVDLFPSRIQEEELEELTDLEREAKHKANELEQHIELINRKRVKVIAREYRQSLIHEANEDLSHFVSHVDSEYSRTVENLRQELNGRLKSIDLMQQEVEDISEYLRLIKDELRDQRIKLNCSFDTTLQSLQREKEHLVDTYKFDSLNYIECKVKKFEKKILNSD